MAELNNNPSFASIVWEQDNAKNEGFIYLTGTITEKPVEPTLPISGNEIWLQDNDINDGFLYLKGAYAEKPIEPEVPEVLEAHISTLAQTEKGSFSDIFSTRSVIKDTINYENLIPNQEYTLIGTLVNSMGAEVIDKDGNPISVTKTFIPTEEDGIVEMTFTYDSTINKYTKVVCFETLLLDGEEISSHKDLDDTRQTISYRNKQDDDDPKTVLKIYYKDKKFKVKKADKTFRVRLNNRN